MKNKRNLFSSKLFPCFMLSLLIAIMHPALGKGFAVFEPAPVDPPPVSPRPFDVIGFLEAASVDQNNAAGTRL